jgi:hypothetical protein
MLLALVNKKIKVTMLLFQVTFILELIAGRNELGLILLIELVHNILLIFNKNQIWVVKHQINLSWLQNILQTWIILILFIQLF